MIANWSASTLRHTLSFGVPFVPHSLAHFAIRMSDRAMLNQFVPLHDQGLYGLAAKFNEGVLMVLDAFNSAWNPVFQRTAQEQPGTAKAVLARTIRVYFFLLLGLVLTLSVFSREIVRGFSAAAFHASYAVVPLLVGSGFFRGLYLMGGQQLIFAKATRYLPVATGLGAIVGLGSAALLVPKWGMAGAALSGLMATGVMALVALRCAQQVYPLDYGFFRLAMMAAGCAALIAASYITTPALALALLIKSGYVAVFVGWCLLTGGIRREELAGLLLGVREVLRKALRRLRTRSGSACAGH
jgi:O-antigen/teichoic acid export membrane protein